MSDEKEVKTTEASDDNVQSDDSRAENSASDGEAESGSENAPAEEGEKGGEEKAEEDSAGEDVEVPEKFKSIVDAVESMSVLDLHELVKLLEKKFGVSAAAVAVAGAAAGGDAAGAEEKDSFDVELVSGGDSKIQVIKVVKAALGLGLKEAKDLVDGAPAMLKEGMKKEDAEALKADIEGAGGKVELK